MKLPELSQSEPCPHCGEGEPHKGPWSTQANYRHFFDLATGQDPKDEDYCRNCGTILR